MSNVFDVLKERELIEQITHEKELQQLLSEEKVTFYIGFDPTADSLHIGHFVSLMVSRHMQQAGHKPIILIGDGTVSIGDPSGKTEMRRVMTREEINNNVSKIKVQLNKFLDFTSGKNNQAIILYNSDWLLNLNYIEFMKNIGSHFSINKMLAAECYKQRLEQGLTFFELGYMLMQAYDFLYLHDKYGCKVELGGNDQWSNIIAGVNLIRKLSNDTSYGLTFRLLTTKEGKKMGKTEKGALWLDPNKTSPYEFYQYWRNISDEDIRTVLSLLTFLPMCEVDRLSLLKDEKINQAKKIAAFEITKLIHGEVEAIKAEEASNALFEGNGALDNMPSTKLHSTQISILDALILVGFASSKTQARTLLNQGGLSINSKKITDPNYIIEDKDFNNGFLILKKGKKIYHRLEI